MFSLASVVPLFMHPRRLEIKSHEILRNKNRVDLSRSSPTASTKSQYDLQPHRCGNRVQIEINRNSRRKTRRRRFMLSKSLVAIERRAPFGSEIGENPLRLGPSIDYSRYTHFKSDDFRKTFNPTFSVSNSAVQPKLLIIPKNSSLSINDKPAVCSKSGKKIKHEELTIFVPRATPAYGYCLSHFHKLIHRNFTVRYVADLKHE
ncbi:unnamed protein product [Nesidiocoris tenuis]|uniref:Uncharacterized protein n=1 Tax=Nesidiocoris tenuis TaxID=355587 RepID=A0A6H5HCL2_9HEMI|nr:unnamed protein product [Nesidiocoris tenuis]